MCFSDCSPGTDAGRCCCEMYSATGARCNVHSRHRCCAMRRDWYRCGVPSWRRCKAIVHWVLEDRHKSTLRMLALCASAGCSATGAVSKVRHRSVSAGRDSSPQGPTPQRLCFSQQQSKGCDAATSLLLATAVKRRDAVTSLLHATAVERCDAVASLVSFVQTPSDILIGACAEPRRGLGHRTGNA